MWIRLLALYGGLALFGLSIALTVESDLGNFPWDVLHAGLAKHLPISIGMATIGMSAVVMLLWIPLRRHLKIGLGTISNAVLVGVFMDLFLSVLPTPENIWVRIAFMLGGIVLNGIATALYIVPNFGPGPRDGLMTGLVAATGKSVFAVRSTIEIVVMAAGWALGGRLFIGTFLYAFGVGFVTQTALRLGERWLGPADPLTTDET